MVHTVHQTEATFRHYGKIVGMESEAGVLSRHRTGKDSPKDG